MTEFRHTHDGSDFPHTHDGSWADHGGGPHGQPSRGTSYDSVPGLAEFPAPCPHCESPDMDRGAFGLDSCNRCGGLSRFGKPLERHDGQAFYDNVIVVRGEPPVEGDMRRFLHGLADMVGGANPLALYLPDGLTFETLDDEEMEARGWVRVLHPIVRLGVVAFWLYEHGQGPLCDGLIHGHSGVSPGGCDWCEAVEAYKASMRGTDAVSTEEEVDGPAATDQSG